MRSKITTAVLVSLLGLAASACGGGGDAKPTQAAPAAQGDSALVELLPEDIKKSRVVKGGSSFTTPPLYTFEADGKTPSGVLIKLIENAAEHMGVTVEWSQIPYAGIIPGMNSGKIDISGSQFSATAANLEAANILSVYKNTVALVVPAKEKTSYTEGDLTGACGRDLAVVRGSTIEPPAVEKINTVCRDAGKPEAKSVPFGGAADALTAIKAGRVDGFLLSYASAVYDSEKSSGEFATVFGGQFEKYPSGFAIQKDQTRLAEAFRAAFDATIKDGSYAKIMESYNMPADLYATEAGLNEQAQ
ncbi:transporter substrate-binding domain-containing protein [Nonomuraea wenchangensis]|uniref:transporter substrate-binding domain-containing protein n=1 Tax=Nonomuraea wenchangensis TaxID=568860 RepID=UPI0034333E21